MFKKAVVAVIFVLALMVTPAFAQDAIAFDTPVEAEAVGVPVQFTLDLTAGQAVLIDVVSPDFGAEVFVSGASGEVARTDEGGENFNDVRMAFVAPADDTYTITTTSTFGDPEGMFTISVSELAVTPLAYGDSLEVDPAGAIELYYTIEGAAGDVLNIYAVTSDRDDTRLTLMAPNASEVEDDDDDGTSTNPYIRRVVLPVDGTYVLMLSGTFGSEMTAPLTLTLEQTEILPIGADPISVPLGELYEVEVFTFEATSGTFYRFNVASESGSQSFRVNLRQVDEEFDTASASFTDMRAGVVEFAAVPGTNRIVLDASLFSGDTANFVISLEEIGQ